MSVMELDIGVEIEGKEILGAWISEGLRCFAWVFPQKPSRKKRLQRYVYCSSPVLGTTLNCPVYAKVDGKLHLDSN